MTSPRPIPPVRRLPAVPPAPPAPRPPAPRPPAPLEFLTVTEVAARMRVSKMTVYRLVHGNELAAVRVGRSMRIPTTAVARYLADASIGGAA